MVHISVSWNNAKWDQKHLKSHLKRIYAVHFLKKVFIIVSSKYSKVYISETQTAKVDVLHKVIYPKYSKH